MRKSLLCYTYALLLGTAGSVIAADGTSNGHFSDCRHAKSNGSGTGFFINEQVPSIPLIVKTPYLQAWMPIGAREPRLAGRWCEFWTGQQQGWTGFVRVDGHAYTFMGEPSLYGQSLAVQRSYEVHLIFQAEEVFAS